MAKKVNLVTKENSKVSQFLHADCQNKKDSHEKVVPRGPSMYYVTTYRGRVGGSKKPKYVLR